VIREDRIPALEAMWAEAIEAFRTDDAYVVEMAEASVAVCERREAQRAREAVREASRVERLEARRARSRERQAKAKAQRAVDAEAKRTTMRAADPTGLSDATVRYRAKMAAMTPDERKAFHKAKNDAHAARRAQAMTPEEQRERRNANARAKRAAMTPEARSAMDRERNARARAAMTPERKAEMREYQRTWAERQRSAARDGDVGGAA